MPPRASICSLLLLALPAFCPAASAKPAVAAKSTATADTATSSQEIYKTVGDVKLTVDIDTPAGWKPGDKRPAIVFFFGGSWNTGSPQSMKSQAEYFAKRGMVCFRPDYRVRSRQNVTPDKCVEDAISAMRWVRANAARLGVDPARIVAAGASAGAHVAACTFFTTTINAPTDDKTVSPKPSAMVLYFPALDLHGRYTASDPAPFDNMSASVAKEISPLLLMKKDMPPTLVVAGTADSNYRNCKAFVDKGKKLGAPVEGFYAEGQPHAFLGRPGWFEKVMARVDAFFVSMGYLAPAQESATAPVAPAKKRQ